MKPEIAARRRAEAMNRIEEMLVSWRGLTYTRPTALAEWRSVRDPMTRLTLFLEAAANAMAEIQPKIEEPLREKTRAVAARASKTKAEKAEAEEG